MNNNDIILYLKLITKFSLVHKTKISKLKVWNFIHGGKQRIKLSAKNTMLNQLITPKPQKRD
jgi:hypothetical protein